MANFLRSGDEAQTGKGANLFIWKPGLNMLMGNIEWFLGRVGQAGSHLGQARILLESTGSS